MYLVRTPRIIKKLFPDYIWSGDTSEKTVYLTFDDGPVPEATPWVLDLLKKHNVKGTFFCVGANVKSYPEIFERLLQEGHAIGNHTYNHISGWSQNNADYYHDIAQCQEVIDTNLFRPPYGRIKKAQAKKLSKGYKIVMWDILSGDFDKNLSSEDCLHNVIKNLRPGAIIVFHDSIKSIEKLRYVLPRVLKHLKKNGYSCENLSFLNQAKSA